jgi:sugar/nucleoside kinase (ribokinase family)
MNLPPSLVCLGNLTIDDVVLPGGIERPDCTGGDALYATLAARAWESSTELVAPIGRDFPEPIAAQMRRAGLSDEGIATRDSPTLRNRVEYFADGRRVWTLFATEREFELLSPLPADIPASYREAKGFMVLAMTLGAQRRLVADLRATRRAIIALDPQEDYIKGNEAILRKLIGAVDIFLPSSEEVEQLLGHADWSSAARTFAEGGPAVVVIKLGAAGCFVYDRIRDIEFRLPAFPVPTVVDTTGAGDSFCGAFMAQYLRAPGELKLAAMAGAVAASFTVSGYGVDPLFQTGIDAMHRRFKDWVI